MKRIFITGCMFLIFYKVNGQSQNEVLKKVNIASPTASELGKYVDMPVSYHTAVPNISIPIYTVKEGAIQVPVSLSYHASGIRVAEVAGWVGLGWSLNAGGVISRSVNSLPDDRASLSNQTHGHFSEYGFNNYLFNGTPPSTSNIDDAGFLNGYKDSEPDLFSFNFNGYSGKFYFRDDRTPMLVPQQDIKIIPATTNNIHITSFTIITPDGLKYEFGKTASTTDTDPIELTNVLTPSSGTAINQNTISSWYLNKITNASSSGSVSFIYEEEKYTHYGISMPQLDGTDEFQYDHGLIKSAIKGVRLKEIVFSDGQILFNAGTLRTDLGGYVNGEDIYTESANTEAKSLGNIQITGDGFCKKYDFSYGYFEDNANSIPSTLTTASLSNDRRRLKLLSVTEKTCDNTATNAVTSFNYFTEQLPRRLSFASDHWGFNNGATGNTKVTSSYTIDTFTTIAGANREPSWPQMRASALKEIIYPTGGKTEFEFEPHTTWVSSTKYNENFIFSMQMGFDGGSSTITQYQTLNANYHKITIQNTDCPPGYQTWVTCLSSLRIYNASNQEVFYMTVPVNSSGTKVVYLPQGTYRFELFKDKGTYTGTGCIASTYEMPSYTHNRNEIVGGLRIKNLKQYDNINADPIVTSFNYDYANLQSAGVLYSRPTYVQVLRNEQTKQVGVCTGAGNDGICYDATPCSPNGCINCDVGQLFYKKSGSPLVPMKNTQGNHIGYSQVKVAKTGNGYSVYKYFGSDLWENLHDDIAYKNVNLKPPCPADLPNWPPPPVPFEYKRGELKEEQYFNQQGNILSEKWYTCEYETILSTFTPARVITYAMGSGSGRATEYNLVAKKKINNSVTERNYNLVTGTILSTVSTSFYESPYHNNLTRIVSTDSRGETTESKYKYAFDYVNAGCEAISNCYTTYAGDLAYHTGNYQAALSSCGNNYACKWNAFQAYRINCAQIRVSYLNCRANNFTNSSNIYDNCFDNAIAAADGMLKPVYWLKKKGRNPLIETTSWKSGKLTSAEFYRYDMLNGNADQLYVRYIDKINLAAPSVSFQPSSVSGVTIVRDSRYETEAELKSSNENLLQAIGRGGTIISYLWGYGGKSPVAEITGKLYDDVINQSGINLSILNSPASESALRTELDKLLTLQGAMSTTYTYKPLLGISSATDTRGRRSFYEYDLFGRLKLVRDHDNNILKIICYNYAGQPEDCSVSAPPHVYYNVQMSQSFTRNNCPACQTGSQVTYTVPQGAYSSTTSQGAADQLAQNDINANGQNYANTNGSCTSGSDVTITYQNETPMTGFVALYTNNSTGQTYSFNVPASGNGSLGCVPAGIYSLSISKSGNTMWTLFGSGCFTQSGTSAFFGKVNVSSCNTVIIGYDY